MESLETKKKILVLGTASLDILVQGEFSYEGNEITVKSAGKSVVFKLEDEGPIELGQKYFVNQDVSNMVKPLWTRAEPGGGGLNSVIVMRRFADPDKLELYYMDVSMPDQLMMRKFRENSIDSRFLFERPTSMNVILGGREDKIILKGPRLEQVGLTATDQVIDYARQKDSVLVNSVRDASLLEVTLKEVKKNKTPLYFVWTQSLPKNVLHEKLVPEGIPILNYDDIPKIFFKTTGLLNDKIKMEMALETMRQFRKQKKFEGRNIYTTLGKNGVYCSSGTRGEETYHVKLDKCHAQYVRKHVLRKDGSTTGAGDAFAAAVIYYETINQGKQNIIDTAIRASTEAIKHIGYKGCLNKNAFIKERIK